MERAIPPSRITDEVAFVRRQLDALASQKVKYDDSFSAPLSKRSRRAPIANIIVQAPPVLETPTPSVTSTSAGPTTEAITLLVKSTKPALSYTLSAAPTATIAALKAQLVAENPGAPPTDAQRWVWSGKAMTDNKLLREFEGIGKEASGAKVFLMVKAGWAPTPTAAEPPAPIQAPSPSAPVGDIPSIQLEPVTPTSALAPSKPHPALVIDTSNTAAEITPFARALASPLLWADAHGLLLGRLGDEEDARRVWEGWFGASKHWLTPSQVAAVRDRVGIIAMAGT